MNKLALLAILLLSGCQMQQPPGGPSVYTTKGSPGGVSYSHYESTPL